MLWDNKACFKAILVITLLFSLIGVTAMAAPSDSTPFITVINGSSDPGNPTGYKMLEPGSSLTDGNWIILTGGSPVRIPDVSVNYNGLSPINVSQISGLSDLPFFSTFKDYSNDLVYVSPLSMTVPFNTYPVYTEGVSGLNDVHATFYGSSDYAGKMLTVKLLDLSSVSDNIVYTNLTTIKNTMKQLTLSEIKSSQIGSFDVQADASTGDIQSIESHFPGLSGMQQGYYALVVMDYSDPNFPCIVSEAPIIVTHNTMDVSMLDTAPKPGDSISFVENQQGELPDTYTYALAMVPEANYSADINITSDGTLNGTFLTFHGLSLNETFNVVSDGTSDGTMINFDGMARQDTLTKDDLQNTSYMEQLAKDELAQSNIAFAIKTPTDTSGLIEVPTTSTMPVGKYIVLTVALDRDTGKIAAINQTTIDLGYSFTYNLVEGWNLISVPLDCQNNVEDFFPSNVKNEIVDLWGWESDKQNWTYYSPDPTSPFQYFDRITTLDTGKAYWVNMNSSQSFTIQGIVPAGAPNATIPLVSYWNLIGVTGMDPFAPDTLYPTAVDVWRWDATIQRWAYYSSDPNTPFKGYESITTIQPGQGVWVNI